jgi:epoxide hydrolase-like predicted phosphatase
MTDRPVRAVLFDFGGVFIPSPFDALERFAEEEGLDAAALQLLIFGPYDSDTDHPWHRLERGEISFEAARLEIGELGATAGFDGMDPITVLAKMGGRSITVRDYMVEFTESLRDRGIATGIITNNIAEFGSTWRGLLDVDALFDDIVDSSAVGVRKPNHEIYEMAVARLGLEAGDALFVDDFEANVVAARAAGLAGVWCGYQDDTTRRAVTEMNEIIARRSARQ